ncbi:hypothetical protein JVT61DRAFT_7500 [Boletus reticuloceps]|uniref:Zn(2)-C6 fungal-type domain-containing protein n=1 Tax=Boletus reticuloceps TaxID=495285 RepID=A0A8I3A765_9AGAM|nr:hypothetical protein JVT61DRAFT_7500 [Boletus reticuloceps]
MDSGSRQLTPFVLSAIVEEHLSEQGEKGLTAQGQEVAGGNAGGEVVQQGQKPSIPREQEGGSEDVSGQTDEDACGGNDVSKVVSVPPVAESTTSDDGSVTSAKPRPYVQVPARTKCNHVILDEDDDEDEEDSRLVKKSTGGPSVMTHKAPCKVCMDRSETCRGPKGRMCFVCSKLKIKCGKSAGRPRKVQKVEEEEVVMDRKGKGKGKVPARAARVRREAEEPIVLVDTDEEQEKTLKKVPGTKTPVAQGLPVTVQVRDAGVCAVKRLEAKILSNQARIKASEAEMAEMAAEVAGQNIELDAIKRALGMK